MAAPSGNSPAIPGKEGRYRGTRSPPLGLGVQPAKGKSKKDKGKGVVAYRLFAFYLLPFAFHRASVRTAFLG